jgi:transcriptional regulator with XRE-family HTH domain
MSQTATDILGQVLARARDSLHRSPEQVGALIGISGRTIRRLEDGEAGRPRRTTLEALSGFYGLNPDAVVWLAEVEGADAELLAQLRQRAVAVLGPHVAGALEDVEDEAVELAVRVARASASGDSSPQQGKTQFVIAFLRSARTASPREHADAVDAFVDFLTLDRSRRALARQMLENLRVAQNVEPEPPDEG